MLMGLIKHSHSAARHASNVAFANNLGFSLSAAAATATTAEAEAIADIAGSMPRGRPKFSNFSSLLR